LAFICIDIDKGVEFEKNYIHVLVFLGCPESPPETRKSVTVAVGIPKFSQKAYS
jgi:hypothetical protein